MVYTQIQMWAIKQNERTYLSRTFPNYFSIGSTIHRTRRSYNIDPKTVKIFSPVVKELSVTYLLEWPNTDLATVAFPLFQRTSPGEIRGNAIQTKFVSKWAQSQQNQRRIRKDLAQNYHRLQSLNVSMFIINRLIFRTRYLISMILLNHIFGLRISENSMHPSC